jgi:hypothetical protein
MLQAAALARRFWGRAGGWLEAERAEYRLALCWLRAGDADRARSHAQACLAIVQAQPEAAALERFFAWEALGRIAAAAGDGPGLADARQQAQGGLRCARRSGPGLVPWQPRQAGSAARRRLSAGRAGQALSA